MDINRKDNGVKILLIKENLKEDLKGIIEAESEKIMKEP